MPVPQVGKNASVCCRREALVTISSGMPRLSGVGFTSQGRNASLPCGLRKPAAKIPPSAATAAACHRAIWPRLPSTRSHSGTPSGDRRTIQVAPSPKSGSVNPVSP